MLDNMLLQKTRPPRERWEKRTENVHILLTPSMKRRLQHYLGDYPVSRWLVELVEKELEDAAEHDRKLAAISSCTDEDGE